MSGTRTQARQAKPVQQLVSPRQCVLDAKLSFQNADCVFATQPTDAVIALRGTGFESFEECRLLVGWKFGGRATTRPRGQCGDASIAVGIRPTLHEPSAARETILNGFGFQPFESQQDDSVSITLLGVPLSTHLTHQCRPIVHRSFLYMHV